MIKKNLLLLLLMQYLLCMSIYAEWPMFQKDSSHNGFNNQAIIELPLKPLWQKNLTIGMINYSSLIISQSMIFIGSSDGRLLCFDLFKGNLKWSFKTMGQIYATPLIKNSRLYFGSDDGFFYCIGSQDGNLIWKFKTDSNINTSAVNEGNFICFGCNNGSVYAINTNGSLLWEKKLEGYIFSSPSIKNDKVVVGTFQGDIFCLNKNNGGIIWKYATDDVIRSSPSIDSGKVFIGSYNGFLYCLNLNNGKKAWEYNSKAPIYSTPAICKNQVFFGAFNGKITALNMHKGKKNWEYSLSSKIYSSMSIDANNNLAFGTDDGKILILGTLNGDLKAQCEIGKSIKSSFAISDKYVVFNTADGNIFCFGTSNICPVPKNLMVNQTNNIYWNGTRFKLSWELDLDKQCSKTKKRLFSEVNLLQDGNLIFEKNNIIEDYIFYYDSLKMDGNYSWKVRSYIENLEHSEWSEEQQLLIDRTPPVTLMTINGIDPNAVQISRNSSCTLSFIPSDPIVNAISSGVSKTYVRINKGEFAKWDGIPINILVHNPVHVSWFSVDKTHQFDVNDNAGNREKINSFILCPFSPPQPPADIIPPSITVSGIKQDGFYNQNVNIAISVIDEHLKFTSISLDGCPFISGSIVSSEGPHSLVVLATDTAGNSSSISMGFVIDRTSPVISISGYSNGEFYGSDVTPIVMITELNPYMNSALLDGSSFLSGTLVQSEGTHNLSVYANDKAGNSSTKSSTFTVDKTAPQITISGVAPGNHYSSKVRIQVSVFDINLKSSSLSIDGTPFQGIKEISSEGKHDLAIRAEDKAGNVSVSLVDFTLDMTPPVIQIAGVEQNKTYTEATPLITLQDLNLDNSKSWITLDNTPFISGAIVTSNGQHLLKAHAEDLAGNMNEKSVNFRILRQSITNSLLFYASYNNSANADQSIGNGNVQSGGEITSSGKGWKIGEALSDTGRGASYSTVNNFNETNGTVMMWVKSSWINAGEQGRYLFYVKEDNSSSLNKYNMNLVVFDSKGTVLQVKEKNGLPHEFSVDKGIENSRWYSDKNWTHIAYTWNAKTGAIKMYLNGVLKGNFTNLAWVPNVKGDLWIGNRHTDESKKSSCKIDEIMIFNRELNLGEIQDKAGFIKISSVYTANTNVKFTYLEKGEKYYCDRDYIITNLDPICKDSLFIKTANNDKQFSANTKYLGFKAEENLDVIIGFDSRVLIPTWLSSEFTAWMENGKQKTIGTTDVGNQKALLFKKSISKGSTIQLNGNGAPNDNTYNYFVILKRQ